LRIWKMFEKLGTIPGPLGELQFLHLFPKYPILTISPTCHEG
jgi:hypothetical protein